MMNQPGNTSHDCFVSDLESPTFFKGELHCIFIPLAANPQFFIFQTKTSGDNLRTLREDMERYYEGNPIGLVAKEALGKNKVFAYKHNDNHWYRVIVTNAPMGSRVPVRLCDYGEVTWGNISNLRELAPEFRVLPFMAVKGKLAGVAPTHWEWTVEDCIRFQNLVSDKFLAAVVVDIQEQGSDEYQMGLVVSLRLVDVSTGEDIDIREVLVSEDRAIRLNPAF